MRTDTRKTRKGRHVEKLILSASALVAIAIAGTILLAPNVIYAGYGTLDMAQLARGVTAGPVAWTALALMTAGLLLKTALFPLHFWLPPAHASAPAPVSAVLSALVVKVAVFARIPVGWKCWDAAWCILKCFVMST